MPKNNAPNERIKRTYFRHLKEAKRLNNASVDMVAAAIAHFETYTHHRDFAQFHIEQAIGFKVHLAAQLNPKSKLPLSKATQLHALSALRNFITWLAEQPRYRKRIKFSDADYFNPHSFRKTLALLGEKVCTTPETFKAWSQNLGHDGVLTTFTSYG